MTNPFVVQGQLVVQASATVICLRRRAASGAVSTLTASDVFPGFSSMSIDARNSQFPVTMALFGLEGERRYTFDAGWEVLLGQSEVINWLKSRPEKLKTMRYAGEWKLPGGNVDEGETVEQAARRELEEEFLSPIDVVLPADATIRPFNVRQTKPIRSRSNILNNFVALESENKWLAELDPDRVNKQLAHKRRRFLEIVQSGAIWKMSLEEREKVTPEVHAVKWIPLRDAIRNCLTSTVRGVYVNAYQKREYERFGKKMRDPMIMTAATLMELEMFPGVGSLLQWCRNVNMDALRANEQFLFAGMSNDEVQAAREHGKTGRKYVMRLPDELEASKAKKRAAATVDGSATMSRL